TWRRVEGAHAVGRRQRPVLHARGGGGGPAEPPSEHEHARRGGHGDGHRGRHKSKAHHRQTGVVPCGAVHAPPWILVSYTQNVSGVGWFCVNVRAIPPTSRPPSDSFFIVHTPLRISCL